MVAQFLFRLPLTMWSWKVYMALPVNCTCVLSTHLQVDIAISHLPGCYSVFSLDRLTSLAGLYFCWAPKYINISSSIVMRLINTCTCSLSPQGQRCACVCPTSQEYGSYLTYFGYLDFVLRVNCHLQELLVYTASLFYVVWSLVWLDLFGPWIPGAIRVRLW